MVKGVGHIRAVMELLSVLLTKLINRIHQFAIQRLRLGNETGRVVVAIAALVVALVANSVVFAGTAAAAPEVNNAQTPDGISDIIEVNYDSALAVDGDADDLEEAFVLDAETENDVEIVDARVGDPETTVVLELSGRIIPQDGDLENALTFDNDATATLVADKDANSDSEAQPAASFNDERVDNELDPPTLETATIPETAPETLRITFENSIEIAGDNDDLGGAFVLDAETVNDVAVEPTGATVLGDGQTVELSLSDPIRANDGDLSGALSFTQLDADDTLRSSGVKTTLADFESQPVANRLDPPALQTATIPEGAPETLHVTFEDNIEIEDTDDSLGAAFKLTADTQNDVTIEPSSATVLADEQTIELELSEAVVPQDSDLEAALSFTQRDAENTLQSQGNQIALADFEEEAVENELDPPAPLTARVPETAPETVAITFEEAIKIDGTNDDLGAAFEIDTATQNDVAIEPTGATVHNNGETLEIALSNPVVAADGNLDDGLSFTQFSADDTLRARESGVVIDSFDELDIINEQASDDVEDTPGDGGEDEDDDTNNDDNGESEDSTSNDGESGTGGGVVTGPSTSVTEGQARILSDADPTTPGTTFEIDSTQLMEIIFPNVDDASGLVSVDELEELPPGAPPLAPSSPFITAFAIEVPPELEDSSARLRIRVSEEMIQAVDPDLEPEDLVVLRVTDDSYQTTESSVMNITPQRDIILESETPGFSIFVVTANIETDSSVSANDTPVADTDSPTPSDVETPTETVGSSTENDRSSGSIANFRILVVLLGFIIVSLLAYARRVATDEDDEYMNRL